MAYPAVTPSTYISPLGTGTSITFVSAKTIYPYRQDITNPVNGRYYDNTYTIRVTKNNDEIFYNEYIETKEESTGSDIGYSTVLESGTYIVFYSYEYPTGLGNFKTNTATYTFVVVENKLPLKRWTCTDVINRLLDLAEPIRKGEKPRFRLQGVNDDGTYQAGSQAAQFDTIYAPEFAFTKQTLRECLQEVGQKLHGEPRLTPKKDSSGNWYFEVSYDLYGQSKPWKQAHRAYIKKSVTQNINTYATSLDTHAENLVNRNGAITEPYLTGGRTARTEQMYVQITETNMVISTQFPIYTVDKLEWVSPLGNSVDITPWLFESSIYSSQLSSYDTEYPYSKAYAIMFTQGEKNITQLTFKPEHPVSAVFENYAILNILRRATGNDSLDINDATGSGSSYTEGGYPQLIFRVTYVPFYQTRVVQTKINYLDYPTEAAMIYNQQSNVMDSAAYGENLKGVVARIGNAEKSYTYHLSRLSQIPKPGMMFDSDYTISGVYVEILPAIINCTVALTKNFNRISRYVGISSVKRYSQISQTQAVERNIVYREYVVIGDAETADEDCYLGDGLLEQIAYPFDVSGVAVPVSTVIARGSSYEGNELPTVCLPVVASAFGNSISFSWEYEDNYSAGPVSVYVNSGTSQSNRVTGYFQNDYQYTDYYGRAYFYDFTIDYSGAALSADVANALPGAPSSELNGRNYFTTYRKQPYLLRKDNREKLQFNVQVDFVTNRKDFIIGSALARNCGALRSGLESMNGATIAGFYVFDHPINKFIDHVDSVDDLGEAIGSYSIYISEVENGQFRITRAQNASGNYPTSGKAWAIVTPQTTRTRQAEDEQGNIVTETITEGGDVLLAQNIEFSAGTAFPPIYFTKKRKIFKEAAWTDIR